MLLTVLSRSSIIQCTLQNTDYIQAIMCVFVFGIFGHKLEEMTGGETNLRNVELRKNLKFHGITEFHDVLAATIPPFP